MSTPPDTPVTTPDSEPTVAYPLLALHTPSGAISERVIVVPAHSLVGPVMTPPERYVPMVSVSVATAVPQKLVTEYITVLVPGDTAVSNPVVPMTAVALLTLHVPPEAVSV